MGDAVVVLSCKDWELSLDAYDFAGKHLATVKPLPQKMKLQEGILHLDRASRSLVLGYRLETKGNSDNPDKGLLVFDQNLKKLREYAVWGDRLCCSDDGSVYAPSQ